MERTEWTSCLPLKFSSTWNLVVKVKVKTIVSSSPLMWHRFFPLLQSVSYILRFPPLLALLNLVYLSSRPLSVSLINAFNYRHFQSPCVHSVVTFGKSCHGEKKRRPKKGPFLPAGVGTGLVIASLCQSVNTVASSHLRSPAGFFQHCLDKWIFALTRICPLKMGGTRTLGSTFHQALVTSSGSHEHRA